MIKQIILFCCLLTATLSIGQEKLNLEDGDISNNDFYLEFGIYNIGTPIDLSTLKANFSQVFPSLKVNEFIADSVSENSITFFFSKDPLNDYYPVDLEYLSYFGEGLSDRQKQKLVKTPEAAMFIIKGLNKDNLALNKKMTKWLSEISTDKEWIIWDGVTRQFFTQQIWQEKRVDTWTAEIPYIPGHISVYSYRNDNEFCRSLSLGLQKFCLPDIVINNASCYSTDQHAMLINIVAQHLLANRSIYKKQVFIDLDKIKNEILRDQVFASLQDNPKKKAILTFKSGAYEDGDPSNQLLEIDFDNKNFESPQLHQEQVLADLFGLSDEITYIEHDDAILQASKEAKAKLPDLKKRFNKGLEAGHTLLLKAPFEDDEGGQEWMWIEVTKWETSTIHGILQNEPFHIKNLKVGSLVTAKQEDIFDYMLYLPDGTTEGNKTMELILKNGG